MANPYRGFSKKHFHSTLFIWYLNWLKLKMKVNTIFFIVRRFVPYFENKGNITHETMVCAVCLSVFFLNWSYLCKDIWNCVQLENKMCSQYQLILIIQKLYFYTLGDCSGHLWCDSGKLTIFSQWSHETLCGSVITVNEHCSTIHAPSTPYMFLFVPQANASKCHVRSVLTNSSYLPWTYYKGI